MGLLQSDESNENEKISNNNKFLTHKRFREEKGQQTKKNEFKIEKSQQSIISSDKKNKKIIQQLNEENKKLKKDNEEKDKIITELQNNFKIFEKNMKNKIDETINTEKERNNQFIKQIQDNLEKFKEESKIKLNSFYDEIPKPKFDHQNEIQEQEIINNNNSENKIIDDNKIKNEESNNNIDDKKIYSYECLTENLNFIINKGTKNSEYTIELKNNGNFPWPQDKTILSSDKNLSTIAIDDIILSPLKPDEKCDIKIFFDKLDEFNPGIYKTYFNFTVDGHIYGNKIEISLEIMDNNKQEQLKI